MQEIQKIIDEYMPAQHFDTLSVAVLDFKKKETEVFSNKKEKLYFDLASLTKPLTLGTAYLAHPELFDEKLKLLLEHRAGLPSHGRLGKSDWRETLLSYEIKDSPTEYSDYGALRLMLEIEKKANSPLKEVVCHFWDKELLFWKDLPKEAKSPVTGFRNGKEISKEVHDDKAFLINEFCSHAGLFSTPEGLAKTLFNLNEKLDLIKKIEATAQKRKDQRFILGWDTVSDPKKTLAGEGCSDSTFGHLGFVGTSMWIDPKKLCGHLILSNGTEKFWYDKKGLNEIRRRIGKCVWQKFN